ncbi:membrane protein [Streptococcus criceti]|uniref:Uncharacterized protein n=1 Tax=Streptococcus criceti HS-6 TaxID=873449 RepID=G5JQ81_STRCG|nr:hypothetical protein [Streptococcus criceti]EHI74997.1 hypothetical protein STRCR_1764 [Streptococcus criceti HS-6]SUN43130.1 membrane protein [Streptococcus criceti]
MEKTSNKFQTILGIILLIPLSFLVIWGMKIAIRWIFDLLKIVKTLDGVILVAIITGLISIITTSVKMFFDFRQNRLQYLTKKREASYTQFIEMIYKIVTATDEKPYKQEEMLEDTTKFNKELTLWGSKKVVQKWAEFRTVASQEGNNGEQLLKISEQVMNEMRKDLGVKKVQENTLLSFFINDAEKLD